ncbi:MAG: hypothetical protein K6G32_10770 [Prevotella sp.]|nr:hypothetical protein [Prevotella sp.]
MMKKRILMVMSAVLKMAVDNPDAHYITCGCNFCDGSYLLFDDGMASDSPGYFFKKLATMDF